MFHVLRKAEGCCVTLDVTFTCTGYHYARSYILEVKGSKLKVSRMYWIPH